MFTKSGIKRKPWDGVGAIGRLDLSGWSFAEALPAGQYVDLPERGKAFVRVARGPQGAPALLLVHGLMATADLNWSLVMPQLAQHFTVVAPDLRGHGRGLPTPAFSGSECAADLAAIVQTMELGRVIVVGYSLGGLIAQLFARRYPQLTAGLVLCSTACSFDVPTDRGLLGLLVQVVRLAPEGLRRKAFMALLAPKDAAGANAKWLMGEVARHDTRAIIDAATEAAHFDSAPWLAAVEAPAAVVVTVLDPVVKPEGQRVLAEVLGAEIYEVEADHSVPVTRPDLFNPTLVQACRSVASEVSGAANPRRSLQAAL